MQLFAATGKHAKNTQLLVLLALLVLPRLLMLLVLPILLVALIQLRQFWQACYCLKRSARAMPFILSPVLRSKARQHPAETSSISKRIHLHSYLPPISYPFNLPIMSKSDK